MWRIVIRCDDGTWRTRGIKFSDRTTAQQYADYYEKSFGNITEVMGSW